MWFQLEVPSTLHVHMRKPQMEFQLQECGYKISFQVVSYQPLHDTSQDVYLCNIFGESMSKLHYTTV